MDLFTTGDDVTVDLTKDTLTNHTTGESFVKSDLDLDLDLDEEVLPLAGVLRMRGIGRP